jgi:hypothetical protein
MNPDLERIQKKVLIVSLEALSWYLPGETEKTTKIPQPRMKLGTSQSQDSNKALPKYKSEVLSLEPLAW